MNRREHNIALIGMPGVGKSTCGIVLAKHVGFEFLDTDVAIQRTAQCRLQSIINQAGFKKLRQLEEEVVQNIHVMQTVIATGGSVIYGEHAMHHLKQTCVIVYLYADIQLLRSRIHDYETRGIAKPVKQSFREMFEERHALYSRYADLTIDTSGLTIEETCEKIHLAIG